MVWGGLMKSSPFPLPSRGVVAFAKTSIGSPSSRLFWQTAAVAGSPGNCQFGVVLLTNGLPNDSASSWLSAVTAWNPAPNRPGEIQLANWLMNRCCGNRPSKFAKYVWKPSTQQPPGVLGFAWLRLKRKVFGY